MKPRLSTKRNAAMTLFEVGIILAVVIFLAAIFLCGGFRSNSGNSVKRRINCVNNLKQIGLAYKIWEGDNGDVLPMGIPVTNGGSMEKVLAGDVLQTFMVMSNELSTPKTLFCVAEPTFNRAAIFAGLTRSNVSYFVGVDVTNTMNPQMIISGDCNFELGGKLVGSGLNSFGTNDPVDWSATRHVRSGNLGFADGSVQTTTSASLQNYLRQTGLATNRFAIP